MTEQLSSTFKHYAMVKDNIVMFIGTSEHVQNSEQGLTWIEIPAGMTVEIGYKYISDSKSFIRVRKSVASEKTLLNQRVNAIFNQTFKMILSSFPEEEVKTFALQVGELPEYIKYINGDTNADITLLQTIAYQKEMELEHLVNNLRGLTRPLKVAIGRAIGRRQYLEEQIAQADDYSRLNVLEKEVDKFARGEYRQ